MKKLLTTTGLSLLLISTAGISYGQAVICSPRTLIGGPDIVAELGIFPSGYSRVGTTNSSGSSSAGGLFQNSVNDIVENARRNNERRAAERGAARQRAHEMEMLERQLEAQNARSSADRSRVIAWIRANGIFERWELEFETPPGTMAMYLTANNDCSLTFSAPDLDSTTVTGVKRSANALSFTYSAATDDPITLNFELSINGDKLSGFSTVDVDNNLRGTKFPVRGTRLLRTGNVPQDCVTSTAPTNRSATPQNRDVEPEVRERATNLVEDLRSLGELHEQGILTDEEFNAAKRRLLGL